MIMMKERERDKGKVTNTSIKDDDGWQDIMQ